jgi:hypothetical protein
MRGIQRHRNLVEKFMQLQEDCVVPEALLAKTLCFKKPRSQKIAFNLLRVMATVQFDHQAILQAGEVDDVGADTVLSSEFPSAQATTAQVLP